MLVVANSPRLKMADNKDVIAENTSKATREKDPWDFENSNNAQN